jgi:hypothetical protein
VKIGTWFVNEGTLAYDYPSWMKYLGFFIDFSYQRLEMPRQQGTSNSSGQILIPGNPELEQPAQIVNARTVGPNTFSAEAVVATLAFMFTGRYGFLPDSEVPFGRLQPYVAVGPGILFSSMAPKLTFTDFSGMTQGISRGSDSAVNICLVADAGIRWMALRNVSIDAFFRYRYAAPSYFDGALQPTFNLFSGNLGVAYHF